MSSTGLAAYWSRNASWLHCAAGLPLPVMVAAIGLSRKATTLTAMQQVGDDRRATHRVDVVDRQHHVGLLAGQALGGAPGQGVSTILPNTSPDCSRSKPRAASLSGITSSTSGATPVASHS